MKNEAKKIDCGIAFSEKSLRVNDSKHFGPERFRTSSAVAVCEYGSCPLKEGVEVNFTMIVDETREKLVDRLEALATVPGNRINQQLGIARLKDCIAYQLNIANAS